MRNPKSTIFLVVTLGLAAGLSFKSYLSANFNWDVLAYVGNALDTKQSPAELHREVYSRAKAALPPAAYRQLVAEMEPEYRAALASDPEAFAKTRRLFQQRVLYIWAIRGLIPLGFEPFHASAAIGAVGAFALCFIGVWWLAPFVPGWALAAGFVPIFYALQLHEIARLSTPDTVACALSLLALYFVFEARRHVSLALTLLAVAMLARTETVILAGMILVWLIGPAAGEARLSRARGFLWLGGFGAIQAGIGHFYPNYSWRLLISYCCLPYHFPTPVAVNFTAGDYVRLLLTKIRVVFNTPDFMLLLVAWGLALAFVWQRAEMRFSRGLLSLLGINLVARFSLFPALEYRYYLLFVVATAIVGLKSIAQFSAHPPAAT